MAAADKIVNFEAILQKIFEKKTVKNDENDCFIWTGASKSNGKKEPNHVYGISRNPFTKLGGERPKMIKTHLLVYMCSLEKNFLKNEFDEQMDISHLCHRSLCKSCTPGSGATFNQHFPCFLPGNKDLQ